MAEKITSRSKDFSRWYQDIVLQAKLADYSPVKGCMVIRPGGYSIWEKIQAGLDKKIKETGTKNAYFPLFIPESFLKKEAEHVEGFAPEVAVVTYAGAKELEEKLVVRPTSETIINAMFAKWIQSYRDLPLMINQWANVVRWEMRTRLFLRTTEFLWQEGHTCHATLDDAEKMTVKMFNIYKTFSEEVLAVPVLMGLKSESEKFAGALRTYTIEAMMQDKKALQMGTSHNLSSKFSKAFNTTFLDKDGKEKLVFQTSWGVSTRLIGGVVMTHSDDKGLVLPPRLASPQVVIIPILGKNAEASAKVLKEAKQIQKDLLSAPATQKLPYDLEVYLDEDDTKQAGWKFHEYELKGVPIRIEIGPRDLEKNQVVLIRRDLGKKEFIAIKDLAQKVSDELVAMQRDLLEKATKFRDENTHKVEKYDDFKAKLLKQGGFFETSWCQNAVCEEKVKKETKATIRCLLLDDRFSPLKSTRPCMVCSGATNAIKVIYSISY